MHTDTFAGIRIISGPFYDDWTRTPLYFYEIRFTPSITLGSNDPRYHFYDPQTNTYSRPYRGVLPTTPYSFPPNCPNPDQAAVHDAVTATYRKYRARRGITDPQPDTFTERPLS